MHQIGKTGRVTLEGRTFELERQIHHLDETAEICERDCPKDWGLPIYQLLQTIRNSEQIDDFNLRNTWEYVQQPDDISRKNGHVAWFVASSNWAVLYCDVDPRFSYSALGVQYAREIK